MQRENRADRSIDDCVSESTSSSAVLVRLLPDYAGTVLWCPHPVAYAATQLDAALVTDLIRWEIDYYDALTEDFGWRTPELAAEFTATGIRLAMRLAVQLGSGFDIEFASYEAGVATRRFRSECPADNPRATAAFTLLARSAA
ncbi:hypothetical protein [Cryobacterium sp. TMB1-7]|uniref:hypothetical protein n=1 Tax=Cryobacterium sp. TMB1-7 TaxID=2555866 RepID=UPI00106AD555|nr:hypothetical protein [Cryobacterium sp. TMB1-7]TFC56186.1 hypothetical protein E3O60_17945 [Cryobacterium sp. TMB1-7]